MKDSDMHSNRMTRGSLLAKLAVAPIAIGALAALQAEADAKVPQIAVLYKDQPKDGKRCDHCKFYIWNKKDKKAKGGCKQVTGAIAPSGYCVLWAAGDNKKNV